MEVTAAILLFLGAVLGFVAFVHLSMNMKIPRMTWLLHLGFVVLGVIALVIYAFVTDSGEKRIDVLVMLGIAAIPGLWLLLGKMGTGTRKGVALVYGLTGMFALCWLLTFVIPQ